MTTIQVERSENGIVSLIFNRPQALNALNLEMSQALSSFCKSLLEDQSVRVLILRGEGRAFMAGGDIHAFVGPVDETAPRITEIMECFHDFIRMLRHLPIPVLACVQGAAAGGGLSIALASDFCIAADNAKFAFAYPMLGTSPDGGSTYALSRLIGAKRAAELIFIRDRFTAMEAKEYGLINWVVSSDRLESETMRIATQLAAVSRSAFAATKNLLRIAHGNNLDEQLEQEQAAFASCAAQPDFAEGVSAFLEKRLPKFA